jgi:hypothetical protein
MSAEWIHWIEQEPPANLIDVWAKEWPQHYILTTTTKHCERWPKVGLFWRLTGLGKEECAQ